MLQPNGWTDMLVVYDDFTVTTHGFGEVIFLAHIGVTGRSKIIVRASGTSLKPRYQARRWLYLDSAPDYALNLKCLSFAVFSDQYLKNAW